jgi:thiol-disulfide isomerase/thioredoxin
MMLLTAAVTLVPLLPRRAAAAEMADYAPGVLESALAGGGPVFLAFAADWCSTCRAQERVIAALIAEEPAYARSIRFIRVDWDDWRGKDVTRTLGVRRRSTLLLLKGGSELGRLEAVTGHAPIKALLDSGLAAAS